MRKTLNILSAVIIGILAGYITSRAKASDIPTVPVQLASPAYTCQFGNGGVNNISPCAQYIIEIAPARLGGGVFIYQVQSNPVDVSTLDESTAAAGTISGTSVQAYLPNSTTNTFTIAITQP